MTKRVLCLFTSLIMVISLVGVLPAVTAGAYVSGDWEYVRLTSTTAQITGFTGNGVFDVEIPSTIDGYTITEIGEQAFRKNSDIETVIMPDTVITIWDYAFSSCRNLSYVKFSSNLKEIHEKAFYITKLKSVVLPEGLQKIYKNCFFNFSNLQTIYVPSSVTQIEDHGITTSVDFIYAPYGSYAQRYANHYGISFRSTTKIPVDKCSKPELKKYKKALKVSWDEIADAEGYNILYSRKKSFKNAKNKTAKGTSKKIKGLKKKKKYYVKVRAYKYYYTKTGIAIKAYGSWSKPKAMKTK